MAQWATAPLLAGAVASPGAALEAAAWCRSPLRAWVTPPLRSATVACSCAQLQESPTSTACSVKSTWRPVHPSHSGRIRSSLVSLAALLLEKKPCKFLGHSGKVQKKSERHAAHMAAARLDDMLHFLHGSQVDAHVV